MASVCTRVVRRAAVAGLALGVVVALFTAAASASSSSGLVSIGAGLKGRSGLSATVAAEGLSNVSALAFDGDGRMWALTAGYEDDGPDALYVVPWRGATPVAVLTGLHTPMGLLWYDAWLYVASDTTVDAYGGFDATTAAFAQHRTVITLPDGVGLLGGLAVDSTGRVSLGVSAPCDSCTPESEYSAAVVSFGSDGSDLRVDVRGVRAPVGLAYYPGTEDLFVTMNQRDDLDDDTPGDWLALVSTGEDWGFPGCYGQGGRACASTNAGDVITALDQHAAASGVAFDADGDAIVAEWARGKVLRVTLARTESGYRATNTRTWIKGIKSPVAVTVGPDGAVYVGDWATGSVYRVPESAES
jgi:glucose/arabinose dehydrogenase